MAAVAVWDHRPTPQELLDARLEVGWKPTPSRLREGERVLGYAACVVHRAAPGAKRTSAHKRAPNKRLKLTAPGLWEELRLRPGRPSW